ncbi:hypothetical protein J6590_077151 [Homalodisca vitripennis]|nr:hypothetical protein J6590_077151 [Homalodisca vitripennis]
MTQLLAKVRQASAITYVITTQCSLLQSVSACLDSQKKATLALGTELQCTLGGYCLFMSSVFYQIQHSSEQFCAGLQCNCVSLGVRWTETSCFDRLF